MFERAGRSVLPTSLLCLGLSGALIVGALGLSCGSAWAQNPFTEEALSRGVDYMTPFGNWAESFGYGVALNDLDGDLDLDLLVTGRMDGAVSVYENDGTGNFADHTVGSGLPVSIDYGGVALGDYDADGDLDVFLSGWLVPNVLMRNDGNLTFTDVSVTAGIGDAGAASGCCWGDFNGDGWLDLSVTNRTGTDFDTTPNRFYINQGNGTFVEVGGQLGVDDDHFGFQTALFDSNRDGWLDLYLSNDKGTTSGDDNWNRLWINHHGHFYTEESDSSGTNVIIDSMGLTVGDMDQNGFLDLYCTNVPVGNKLLMNQGDGTYAESALPFGVAAFRSGWGAMFWDYDNDRYLDLYVANSILGDQMFEYNGVYPCADIAPALGLDYAVNSYCLAGGDIDDDGDLDLVVQAHQNPIAIFINHEGQLRNWIKIRLQGDSPNLFGVGAIVSVRSGSSTQTSQLLAGTSYKSSNPMELHFGLGAVTLIDEIIVHWPGNEVSMLSSVAVNQDLVVSQAGAFLDCNQNLQPDDLDILTGASYDTDGNGIPDECDALFVRGDGDLDGLVNLADAINTLQYVFNNGDGLCLDALDVNDDGSVNLADPISLLGYLFSMGPAPAAPFPDCGVDMTMDAAGLECTVPPVGCP